MRSLLLTLTIISFSHANWLENFTSIELSFTRAILLSPPSGLEIKISDDFYEGKRADFHWGLGLMHYAYDGTDAYASTVQIMDYRMYSTHLNAYLGSNVHVTENFSLLGSMYLGTFVYHMDGSFSNTTYNLNGSETISKTYLDYGFTLGMGYNINDDWMLQLYMFKSLRTLEYPQSFLYWLSGSEDAPTRLNFAIKYYF